MRSIHNSSYAVVIATIFCLVLSFLPYVTYADDDNDEQEQAITCGSVVKIQHKETKYFLNSEEKNLGAGSGQQIVTFIKEPDNQNTMFRIRPANNNAEHEYLQDKSDDSDFYDSAKTCQLAQPITCGTIIRLTHSSTNRNLHSHLVDSVLSHQQEVSCFGNGDAKGDTGDNWIVECNFNNKAGINNSYWKRNTSFRLKHIDTGKYLGTARKLEFNHENCGHNCPIMNHLEAFGRAGTDQHTLLFIDQGVHLSK